MSRLLKARTQLGKIEVLYTEDRNMKALLYSASLKNINTTSAQNILTSFKYFFSFMNADEDVAAVLNIRALKSRKRKLRERWYYDIAIEIRDWPYETPKALFVTHYLDVGDIGTARRMKTNKKYAIKHMIENLSLFLLRHARILFPEQKIYSHVSLKGGLQTWTIAAGTANSASGVLKIINRGTKKVLRLSN